MFGSTPPAAMDTPPRSLFSSSSLRTASWMWRGMMRVFLLSRAALPGGDGVSRRPAVDARRERFYSSARVERRPAPRQSSRTLREAPRERTPLGAGELEDLGAEVLEDGAHVDARRGGHAGRAHLAQVAREARAGELQARLRRGRRAGLAGLALAAATLSFACGGRTVFRGAWRGVTPPERRVRRRCDARRFNFSASISRSLGPFSPRSLRVWRREGRCVARTRRRHQT